MPKKKKILIFSLMYYPKYIGGAEVAIKEITDRIDEYEFDMITLRLDENLSKFERIGDVNVYRVGWAGNIMRDSNKIPFFINLNKYAMLFTGFVKAISLQKKEKYFAIWSMIASYNSFSALFFKLLHPKIPFLLSLQEGDPIPYIKRRALPLWPLFVMIFKKADKIQTISNYLANFAKTMGAKCDVSVVPNGVDIKKFARVFSASEIEIWKEKIGKKNGEIFIVTASRLVKKNATGDIIDSLKFLPLNYKLAIAGTGYLEEELKEKVKKLELESRVVFLGQVSHDDLPALLRACDVFVRPSLSEGFGNSFVEAMAVKIPVVATAVGGITDFLVDNETGLICKVNNPKDLAEKIQIFAENKNIRELIINNAFDMVTQKYDWDIVAKQMEAVFNQLS